MNWFERSVDRLRSLNRLLVDGLTAVAFAVLGVISVFVQEVTDEMVEPGATAAVLAVLTCAAIAVRRIAPLVALAAGLLFLTLHVLLDYPEGTLPVVLLFLTYSAAANSALQRAVIALGAVYLMLTVLILADAPGFDTVDFLGNVAWFGAAWAIGLAVRSRRQAVEARVHQAEERAQSESQRSARLLAEERLRIARELHDVVAHSMSVIAVQAGVGAHVLDDQPDQARAALEAISTTSRGALTEMRQLLGVLREDGPLQHQPTPGLADVRQLVDDVRAAGVPVVLEMDASCEQLNPAVELSAYRVVQEALTNVIKHAGTPSRVLVAVRRADQTVTVEVLDDGRGAAALVPAERHVSEERGHGLVGMRERVEIWGGKLDTGPVTGGGYRVLATLPYGASE